MKLNSYEREAVDRNDPLLPEYYGLFEKVFKAGSRTGRMLVYIPDGTRPSTAGILLVGPDGMKAEEIFAEGSWKRLADEEESREKLVILILEAPENGWNTQEAYGAENGDVFYVNEASLRALDRTYGWIHESKLYLVGIGTGGTMAEMAAVWNPAHFGGVVSVGGRDLPEEYLRAAGEDFCTELNGFQDLWHRRNIRKKDIPLPVWLISDPACGDAKQERLLRYFCQSSRAEPVPEDTYPDVREYVRREETREPLNQDKEAYRVRESCIPGCTENCDGAAAERIWKEFLSKHRRWMSSPEGDLRLAMDPVRDLGMDYHYEMIDGWRREWYVFVPETVRTVPDRKVPLVLAMHGYSCSGEIYAGNSGWYRVADRYGFIVVFPTALPAHVNMPESGLTPDAALLPAWNIFQEDDRPSELSFFRQLLERTKRDYPVDPERVFATGHSWGSLMTQMLGLGMTEEFAAIAPCSGVFFGGASKKITLLPEVRERESMRLPIWMFWGTEEEWLIPAVPDHANETGFTLDYWMKKNGHEEEIPEVWEDAPCSVNGRFLDHFYEGKGKPVRYTVVDYMPHATMPEMSFRIWEEFFSGISRG